MYSLTIIALRSRRNQWGAYHTHCAIHALPTTSTARAGECDKNVYEHKYSPRGVPSFEHHSVFQREAQKEGNYIRQ